MRRDGSANLRRSDRFRQGAARGAVALLLVLGAGCAGADAPPAQDPPLPPAGGSEAPPPPPPPEPGAGRPETVEGSILLEGMREPMTYHLYRSPADHPLPFSTYVPADMVAEEGEVDGAREVRFVGNFGGVRNEDLYVAARFPLTEPGTEEARTRVREIAESLGRAEPLTEDRPPWALESYRFEGEGTSVGRVSLGRHAGRYFFIVTRYPVEAGDGFGPRAQRILVEWRWAEGGGLGT